MKNNIFNKDQKYYIKPKYKEGFITKLKNEQLISGINLNIIHNISNIRKEPKWMLDFRLKGYKSWSNSIEPHWLNGYFKNLNYQNYIYYSAPFYEESHNIKDKYFTHEVKQTFDKLNIPVNSNKNIAVDAIFDSVSVITTHQKMLLKKGIIFCSLNDAIKNYPILVKKYLGSVVPANDNFFAALNAAVASDGTFIYIPKNTHCPIELSTYFRINEKNIGQFERTILIAEENSSVSYIEGCSAPIRNNYQLHAAVVEVILHHNAKVKYSTVQNWFSGSNKKGGILNFVTKRALCQGNHSKMSWTQSETGSAITWKYPSVILKGNNSIGEFFSVSLTNGLQQADTGTKMIHLGINTKSTIISKSISTENSKNTYRGIVHIDKLAHNARNFTQCDSILIGDKCSTHTYPKLNILNNNSQVEHEATTSKIGEEQIFFCLQRGLNIDNAISIIINGFCKEIFLNFPLEFAVEAQRLLSISLENSIG
ncbi:Fe-S cluster assembly protein SufB [Enterobacteriaceae endosymbiont of Neohaemonia nigricornis]|uniref:Fe-S cluster assembly protein SufB n=1 Tax=Enterobacteriaceae endosymbiont of Neohaemonia nigricornis TaxID=2675792 RepID=UPI001448E48D|nr:Fe-S cluster assembly protein SufB [Enterobacteriaceae endosymbiont of Neohaemonia nigricornis]QJC30536.1 Fe-S cluster assembly protein SufB [Enterobacteriaceae endosymbiont of Neohaemonia nigricornis]